MKWNEALRKVEACESDIRKLLADAATQGDYATVLRIADLAKALAALAAEGRGASAAAPMSVATAPRTGRPGRDDNRATSAPPPGTSRKSRLPAETYPKFFRRGDDLVKVAWSKTDRREYNHRAPRCAIDAVVAAVRHLGANGRIFTGDKLLPLKDPADGARLADYQAYVALAWLRHLGIVEQHGRKSGYTLVPDKQIDSIITAAWPGLTEWRG